MSLGSTFRSFWHAMTSYDRHSSYDSPYRTGQHLPLAQSRHDVLTSVATSASESRPDVSTSYFEERHSCSGYNPYHNSPLRSQSPVPTSPYSPGMRSNNTRTITNDHAGSGSPGEIPLQPFQDGLPPPPPVTHSWKRIDSWAEENYPELWDQLCEGCTTNDLNELEHQLDCSLPMEVRESLQVHDGQERGGMPTGIIFGSMLLDCEEIVQEWENWKKVNQEYLSEPVNYKPAMPMKALGGSSSASARHPIKSIQNPLWRQDLLARQDSQPPNAIQRVYAHPAWIPLIRDWGGNNLAIDLAPGPAGKWGQVILFGRDYDCKYVVARSWSAFLATVADDLSSSRWYVDEETNELKLREFKSTNVEPGYLDILRWRIDQKYGRRSERPRSTIASFSGPSANSPSTTPYTSPTILNGDPRGSPRQQLNGTSTLDSPKRSSFSRIPSKAKEPVKLSQTGMRHEKLVEVETPPLNRDDNQSRTLEALLKPVTREIERDRSKSVDVKISEIKVLETRIQDDAMKTIQI